MTAARALAGPLPCTAADEEVRRLRALRAARDRIDREFAGRLDVGALAAAVGYSRAHFIRAFGAAYGETPGRYRTRRRIERAADLLWHGDLPVTEVCLAVGFQSLGTCSARFAEITGRSPSAYRREARALPGALAIPACFARMWRSAVGDPAEAVSALSEKRPPRAAARIEAPPGRGAGGGKDGTR